MSKPSTAEPETNGHKIKTLDADAIAERFGEQLAADPREQPDASSGWRDEYRHQGVRPGSGVEKAASTRREHTPGENTGRHTHRPIAGARDGRSAGGDR